MCGAEIPEGRQICIECMNVAFQPKLTAQVIEPPKANVELSFGAGDQKCDFLIYYYRAKPLNWFQRWMFKVCFGIRARNV